MPEPEEICIVCREPIRRFSDAYTSVGHEQYRHAYEHQCIEALLVRFMPVTEAIKLSSEIDRLQAWLAADPDRRACEIMAGNWVRLPTVEKVFEKTGATRREALCAALDEAEG